MNRNTITYCTLTVIVLLTGRATAQEGFGTNTPNKAAVIELNSKSKGLLIPRVTLTSLTDFNPIKGIAANEQHTANSLMVYNIGGGGGLQPGYYYWSKPDAATPGKWVQFMSMENASVLEPWRIQNTANPATANDQNIYQQGKVAVGFDGSTAASEKQFEVRGDIKASKEIEGKHYVLETGFLGPENKRINLMYVAGGDQLEKMGAVAVDENKAELGTQDSEFRQAKSFHNVEATTSTSLLETTFDNGRHAYVKVQSSSDAANNAIDMVHTDNNRAQSNVNIQANEGVTFGFSESLGAAPTERYTFPKISGTSGDVLVVGTETALSGTSKQLEWGKVADLVPETANTLSSTGNTITSTVNNMSSSAPAVNNVATTLDGTTLTTSVNGVSATADLSGLTNTTRLANGTNTTISGDGSATTPYTVNVTTASGTTLGVVKEATTNATVNINAQGELAVNPATVATALGKNLTVSEGIEINSGSGTGALLAAAGLRIANNGITTAKIADKAVTPAKIANGAANQVLVTNTAGDAVTWVNQSTLTPATTNELTSAVNTITSKVNGVTATAPAVNSVAASLSGNTLTTSVNGVSAATDLSGLTNTTRLANGTNTTVSGNGSAATPYNVNVATANGTNLGVVKQATTNATITINTQGELAVNPTTVATALGKNLTVSEGIEINSGSGTGALLAAAGLRIANNGVTTAKIADKAVTNEKINPGTADKQVLVTSGTGATATTQWVDQSALADNTTADNGLTKTVNNIQLGGNLTKATTITNNGQALTIATGGTATAVTGLPNTSAADYNGTNGVTADKMVSMGANGVLKQLKAAMPKFFYAPSIALPTDPSQAGTNSADDIYYTTSNQTYTIKLYSIYSKQFGGTVTTGTSNTGKVANTTRTTALPMLGSGDMDYYITFFDTTVFSDVTVSDTGIMTYKIKSTADVTIGSFMNIVFAVKP